jgi:PAS domain S-box-containing protein
MTEDFIDLKLNKQFYNNLEKGLFYSDQMQSVIYSLDLLKKTYTYMSPGIIELTGYTHEELNEKGIAFIIEEIVDQRIRPHSSKIFPGNESGEDYSAFYKIKTKSGEYKWIEDISFVNVDFRGTETSSLGILRNVTKLFSFVNNLQDAKEKLDTFLDKVDLFFIVIDCDDNVVSINEKGSTIFSADKSELIGKKWHQFYSQQDADELKLRVKQIFAKKIKPSINFQVPFNKLKEKRVISWNTTFLYDDHGNVIYLLALGEDITERKNKELIQHTILRILQTANSEINLSELFKFIHLSIGKLMKADNFYIALYNTHSQMITFPYFVDEIDPEVKPKPFGRGLTEYVLRTGRSALVDKKQDDKLIEMGETEMIGSQSAIWLGVPLKIQDKTIGIIAVQDYNVETTYSELEKEILEVISFPISRAIERKMLEEEKTVLIDELKKINESKDRLFSLISHDLRSPFHSLLGFSEILTNEYETLTQDEIKEYLKVIHESSKNLFGMTNNLLQFSRFQTGRLEIKTENILLKKAVNTALNLLKVNALKKNIFVKVDIDKEVKVFADEDLLSSILQNLISNAIKFTHKNGDVSISARYITFFNEPSHTEITISDTGVGMSKKDIANIFEKVMFTKQGTEKEYGTGLGMLIVKEFIEKQNGQMKIESKINSGTKIIFTLPSSG